MIDLNFSRGDELPSQLLDFGFIGVRKFVFLKFHWGEFSLDFWLNSFERNLFGFEHFGGEF